ncbi:hypothetical protein ACHAL6_01130 [Proteiniclasticum sp. C24MP]|uniref:hypothetical protein n=1 Tax=Proteiniclasticum sp. C24MP TaxID=3374101 RepID=UPI003753EC0C
MIFFWNRKEVYRGVSVQKFNEIRNMLRAHDIRFKAKEKDSGEVKQETEAVEKSRKYSTIYTVYVHRKDYRRVKPYIR